MELRQLRYFVAIAEHGTFTKAAAKVYVAQSALSHQLAQLEEEVGAMLFHRSRRGVELTEAGQVFHAHALSILRQVEDARDSVASLSESPAGRVVFGIPHSASQALALPLLEAVKQQLPSVQLELTEELTGNLTRQLHAGSIHLAVLFDDGNLDELDAEVLVSERMSLIFRPGQFRPGKHSITLRDALAQPLILPAQPHGVRPIIERAAVESGLPSPNVVADISSISILRTSLLAGMGCTMLPVMPMKQEIDQGTLSALPIISPQVSRGVALCRSPSFPLSVASAAVSRLTRTLFQALCQQGDWQDASFVGRSGNNDDRSRHKSWRKRPQVPSG